MSAYPVPADLSPDAWWRWRAKHPPAWHRSENRRGTPENPHSTSCGECGGELGAVTGLCFACFKQDERDCAAD